MAKAQAAIFGIEVLIFWVLGILAAQYGWSVKLGVDYWLDFVFLRNVKQQTVESIKCSGGDKC